MLFSLLLEGVGRYMQGAVDSNADLLADKVARGSGAECHRPDD